MKALRMGVLILMVATLLGATAPTYAGSIGRRLSAMGLSAGSLFEFAKGQWKTGLLFGAGAGVAWHQYEIARRHEAERDRARRQAYYYRHYSGQY